MNMPPAEMQPMAAPPPPPPVRKSNALKWILIGCGGLAFMGLLVCGGCFMIGYMVIKKVRDEAVAQVRPIIASNEKVKAEIGELKTLTPRWEVKSRKRNGKDSLEFTLDVEGDKGKGTVKVNMYEGPKGDEEVFVVLTFLSQDGSKNVPIGTYRLYDDKKGNSGFEPVDGKAPPVPDDDSED